MRVSGLILCGGQGRRMLGKDKGWVEISGQPMIERVMERIKPQVDEILINANRNIKRYRQFNQAIVEDIMTGYQGPLAGILSAMSISGNSFLACVPCDCPFFPMDLVARMLAVQQSSAADIVSVSDGYRTHPVFALIKTDLQSSLEDYLQSGQRKIDRWYGQHNYQLVEYSNAPHFFENINTPEQLELAQRRIQNDG